MFETSMEACHEWVKEFNSIPEGVVTKLMNYDPDSIEELTPYDKEDSYYDILPVWGTMWTFGDSLDDDWVEYHGGLQIMKDCGFRVYRQEDFGIIFGINGYGYDFYEQHWLPLYKARGLKWSKEDKENNNV